jgi:hypothetical protein
VFYTRLQVIFAAIRRFIWAAMDLIKGSHVGMKSRADKAYFESCNFEAAAASAMAVLTVGAT